MPNTSKRIDIPRYETATNHDFTRMFDDAAPFTSEQIGQIMKTPSIAEMFNDMDECPNIDEPYSNNLPHMFENVQRFSKEFIDKITKTPDISEIFAATEDIK